MSIRWRLFEEKDGALHTLFHGVDGSRRIEEDRWYQANTGQVRDSAGPTYRGGFHVFASKDGLNYLGRFRKPRKLVAAQVIVRGDVRPKPTNPDVLLASEMRLPSWGQRITVKEAT